MKGSRMGTSARGAFKSLKLAPNFMTPEPLEYGFISPKSVWVWEISKGTGFNGQPIYGVTTYNYRTKVNSRTMSKMFDTLKAARLFVGVPR